MPFDWIRISLKGLMYALQTDFKHFLEYSSVSETGSNYIAAEHRFFHDILDDPRDIAKYHRRFARFRALRNTGPTGQRRPLIFLRTPDTTVELTRMSELYSLLVDYFDSSVYLLLILDHQLEDRTVFFEETPHMIVHTISRNHSKPREYDIDTQPFVTAYHEPILRALWYATCGWQPNNSIRLPSLKVLLSDATGLLQHVSLGENLERYNYGIPQMPPDEVLLGAMAAEHTESSKFVRDAVQARIDWEAATGNPSQNSEVGNDFLQWMADSLKG